MVKTPWYDEQIPFVEAAEIGTEKVIKDHSTIGIVVTTDGSIGEISRDDYVEAETRVINELKEYGKPFIVILNSVHPMLPETEQAFMWLVTTIKAMQKKKTIQDMMRYFDSEYTRAKGSGVLDYNN
jgi:hypothetical protein